MRQLISSDEGMESDIQHKSPCSDCPWARKSLRGWLGGVAPGDWIKIAHLDSMIDCHTITNQQCAGSAVYRANVGKLCRDSGVLRLPKDMVNVFSNPAEFLLHHTLKVKRKNEI